MPPKGTGEKGTRELPELKVHLSDELDRRFRKTAMSVHGYGRGSISKAANEALSKWCTEHEQPNNPIPAEASQNNAPTVSPNATETPRLGQDEKRYEETA